MKFWTFVKGKAKGLLGKIGFGKGKVDKKDRTYKKEEDLCSTAEKQKDLEEGIKEGTSYLKQNKRFKKVNILSIFEKIIAKYQLVDLKLIVDKQEKDNKYLVHVHGKVNPEKDGNILEIELEDEIALRASSLPVKENDLIKAKYVKGKFLADIKEIHQPSENNKEDFVKHEFRYKGLSNAVEKNTFKQFLAKWKDGDIEKVNGERKYLMENRPSYKARLVEEVWENAKINGRVFDPNIRPRKELFWDRDKISSNDSCR